MLGPILAIGAPLAIVAMVWGGTYNGLQRKDEGVKGAERTVASCYQKRADLLTNLESTVKEAAGNERGILKEVTEARASAGKLALPAGATAEQIREMGAAIAAQSTGLSRLLAVAEAYPDIKSNKNFLQLQKDLKDTEQQCAIVRNRYIDSIKVYNTSVRTFPANIIAGYHGITVKEQIKFEDEASNAKSPRMFQKK